MRQEFEKVRDIKEYFREVLGIEISNKDISYALSKGMYISDDFIFNIYYDNIINNFVLED